MSKPVRSRRLIAVFAAYLVALQGFLLPLTVAAFAAPESVLCTTAGETSHRPATDDAGCACAAGCGMQCGTSVLAGPSPQAIIAARTAHRVVAAPALSALVVSPFSEGIPHSPRAPPFV